MVFIFGYLLYYSVVSSIFAFSSYTVRARVRFVWFLDLKKKKKKKKKKKQKFSLSVFLMDFSNRHEKSEDSFDKNSLEIEIVSNDDETSDKKQRREGTENDSDDSFVDGAAPSRGLAGRLTQIFYFLVSIVTIVIAMGGFRFDIARQLGWFLGALWALLILGLTVAAFFIDAGPYGQAQCITAILIGWIGKNKKRPSTHEKSLQKQKSKVEVFPENVLKCKPATGFFENDLILFLSSQHTTLATAGC